MTEARIPSPKIAYLVPDTTDPAVLRRSTMLQAGGAEVAVIGFHRRPLGAADAEVIGLGLTYDADFLQRMLAVARWLLKPTQLRRLVSHCDAVVARNLEMLLLARVALIGRPAVPLIYECLDVHRLMIGKNLTSGLLRRLEARLMRRAGRAIISSPAFQRNYFDRYHRRTPTALLVENRLLALDGRVPSRDHEDVASPPWRIGWFGMIRCRRSLDILADLAAQAAGQIEVIIRGRPSPAVFADLEREVRDLPGVTFAGPYDASDLASLYGAVDFVWAIDFFEAGLNSAWLLPNRLYEGGAFDRPIIAQDGVETARWLTARGAGLVVTDPATDLKAVFDGMTATTHHRLVDAARQVPRSDLLCDQGACRDLVRQIAGASPA